MQAYTSDEDIYFFGFSRGAYVARFLAEMLDYVGLLSVGNEEMARKPFKKSTTRVALTEARFRVEGFQQLAGTPGRNRRREEEEGTNV